MKNKEVAHLVLPKEEKNMKTIPDLTSEQKDATIRLLVDVVDELIREVRDLARDENNEMVGTECQKILYKLRDSTDKIANHQTP